MFKYVLKRIALAFITCFIILSLTFILMKILPFQRPLGTDEQQYAYYMIQYNLGYVTYFRKETVGFGELLFKYVDGARKKYFFYQVPVMQQYFAWIKGVFTEWNWGTSVYIMPNISAMTIILTKLPVSIKLNIFSVLFSVPLGILLGIIAAINKNKPTDNIISTGIMILVSVPYFVMITFLIYIFGFKLKWLPTSWPVDGSSTKQVILGYIIPVFALSFGSVCGYARFTRAELCEVMESEYLLLARTKGLTKRQALVRHALKNAMVPIIPSILYEFIGLFSGSMILENLYGIPGIGSLFLTAFNLKDYNVLFVDMAITTIVGLLAGVLLDLSYGFIDPRIRMGAKK